MRRSSPAEIPRTAHQHRKRKSRTLPANYFQVHTAYAVYCEFGDFSSDFVRPYQLDQSLNPNRKQVREFAPPYKASDTEAAEQCFEPYSRVLSVTTTTIVNNRPKAFRAREWVRKRTGHQHRKRKSRTLVLLFCAFYLQVHTAKRYIASSEIFALIS